MSAPRLNRRLGLETLVRTADNSGGFVETWQLLGTLWAQVSPRRGSARAQHGQAFSSTAYEITLRAAPPGASARPEPGQRFSDGQRVFVIEAVLEGAPTGLYLTCIANEEVAT